MRVSLYDTSLKLTKQGTQIYTLVFFFQSRTARNLCNSQKETEHRHRCVCVSLHPSIVLEINCACCTPRRIHRWYPTFANSLKQSTYLNLLKLILPYCFQGLSQHGQFTIDTTIPNPFFSLWKKIRAKSEQKYEIDTHSDDRLSSQSWWERALKAWTGGRKKSCNNGWQSKQVQIDASMCSHCNTFGEHTKSETRCWCMH